MKAEKLPVLLVFGDKTSGPCRRADAFLAGVLQRRANHQTFFVRRIDVTARPDLADRFRILVTPTLLIVDDGRVARRLVAPRGRAEIERFLAPWLR